MNNAEFVNSNETYGSYLSTLICLKLSKSSKSHIQWIYFEYVYTLIYVEYVA